MTVSWLPNTSQGRMFGDYISTSLLPGGPAFPVIPVANTPSSGQFDLAMYIPTGGLSVTGGAARSAGSTATLPHTPARTAAPQIVH
jgi:hypothetical protein